MIHKQLAPECGRVRVTFELPSSVWGDRISVVGDFNEWRPSETPLRQDRAGVWSAVVDLPEGLKFEFCYLVDGRWHTDHNADGSCPNGFGGENSIVDTSLSTVPQRRPAVRAPARMNTSAVRGATAAKTRTATPSPGGFTP